MPTTYRIQTRDGLAFQTTDADVAERYAATARVTAVTEGSA